MSLVWVICIALGALLAGYAWGHHQGLQEGTKLGRSLAPLELRQRSLEMGYCLLCQRFQGQEPYHSSLLML